MLERHDQVPHFSVRTVGGEAFTYSSVWQRKNLLLIVVPASGSNGFSVSAINAREHDFDALETACVITHDHVPGMTAPAALVADRWGEIVYVASAAEPAQLPAADELVEWLEYVPNRCPECEGEAR